MKFFLILICLLSLITFDLESFAIENHLLGTREVVGNLWHSGISLNGSFGVIESYDNTIVWDFNADTLVKILYGPSFKHRFNSTNISNDGMWVINSNNDLYDVSNDSIVRHFNISDLNDPNHFKVSPNFMYYACLAKKNPGDNYNLVVIYSINNSDTISSYTINNNWVSNFVFSSDSSIILATSDKIIKLNFFSGLEEVLFSNDIVSSSLNLKISSNKRFLALFETGFFQTTKLRYYDLLKNKLVYSNDDAMITDELGISSDGSNLAFSNMDGNITIYDVTSHANKFLKTNINHYQNFDFAGGDNKLFLSSITGDATLYDINDDIYQPIFNLQSYARTMIPNKLADILTFEDFNKVRMLKISNNTLISDQFKNQISFNIETTHKTRYVNDSVISILSQNANQHTSNLILQNIFNGNIINLIDFKTDSIIDAMVDSNENSYYYINNIDSSLTKRQFSPDSIIWQIKLPTIGSAIDIIDSSNQLIFFTTSEFYFPGIDGYILINPDSGKIDLNFTNGLPIGKNSYHVSQLTTNLYLPNLNKSNLSIDIYNMHTKKYAYLDFPIASKSFNFLTISNDDKYAIIAHDSLEVSIYQIDTLRHISDFKLIASGKIYYSNKYISPKIMQMVLSFDHNFLFITTDLPELITVDLIKNKLWLAVGNNGSIIGKSQNTLIYPNPVKNELNIKNLTENSYNYKIVDPNGKTYLIGNNYSLSASHSKIDLTGLDSGIYYLILFNDTDEIISFSLFFKY